MTNMVFYRYRIEYYVNEDNRIRETEGLTFGTAYVDAVARLLNYYGEDEVISFSLHAWDDWNCIEMPYKILTELENYDGYTEYLAAAPSTDSEPDPAADKWINDTINKYANDNIAIPIRPTWRAYSWTQQKDYPNASKIVNAYYGATIDEIKVSSWYRNMVEGYGENDIIFEEI